MVGDPPLADPVEAGHHQRLGQPAGQDQRRAGDDAHHAERDDQRVEAEPRREQPVDRADQRAEADRHHRRQPDIHAVVAVQHGDDHAHQPGDRRHRKVEPAGDDQRRSGRRHQPDEGDVGADRHHVAHRHEERRQQREDQQEQDVEDEEHHHAGGRPAEKGQERAARRAGDRGDGLGGGHLAASVYAALKAGSLAVAAISVAGGVPLSKRPTTRPRSSTIARSPIPATSSTSEETTSTARPRSASARNSR